MGQQMMIIALLASFLVSSAILGLRGAWNDSTDLAASQFEEEQVINLSSTGVNMCLSQLRQNKNWRNGFSNLSFSNGTINARVTDIGEDSVRITSVASYNGETHTSVVDAELASMVPMAESALAIYGDEINWDNAGKAFGVDGNDHDVNGNRTVGQAVHGISVPSSGIQTDLKDQLNKAKVAKNVTGQGSNPSVGVATITNKQVIDMRDFFKSNATLTLPSGHDAGNTTYGSLSNPAIVYVNGDKRWTGTVKGTGVLVVDGSLKCGGNFEWTGLVITVAHDIDLEFGDHGNPEFNGAVMVGNEIPSGWKQTDIKINGNPQINYSSIALETVMSNLGMNQVQVLNYYE